MRNRTRLIFWTLFVLVVLIGLLGQGLVYGQTYYVSPSGDDTDGLSWTTAFDKPSDAKTGTTEPSRERALMAVLILPDGVMWLSPRQESIRFAVKAVVLLSNTSSSETLSLTAMIVCI